MDFLLPEAVKFPKASNDVWHNQLYELCGKSTNVITEQKAWLIMPLFVKAS